MTLKPALFVLSSVVLTAFSSGASAGSCHPVTMIKQIVCQSTATYEEATPEQKTPASGIKIFTAGTRKDVKKATGNFLLSEFGVDSDGGLAEIGNQQFAFCATDGGLLKFEFLAPWKASGELQVITDNTASGSINQKGHVTDLSCAITR